MRHVWALLRRGGGLLQEPTLTDRHVPTSPRDWTCPLQRHIKGLVREGMSELEGLWSEKETRF